MMPRRLILPSALLLLAGSVCAQAPQPEASLKQPEAPAKQPEAPAKQPEAPAKQPEAPLREVFKQGKDLWANQGDRDGAAAKFEQVLSAVEPKAKSLDAEWAEMLCETYNWLGVLDDRSPAKKADSVKRLEALVGFNPDFELDKNITSAKLLGLYDSLRSARFAKVSFTFQPDGGVLKVDGIPGPSNGSRYLAFGPHKLLYTKPGFGPQEVPLDLAVKDVKNVDFQLDRNASTITFYTFPNGVDISLDGKPLGKTAGQAPLDAKAIADKAGVKVEDLSGPFVVSDLKVGKHILELKSACFRPKRVELDESFTTPYADHILEAIKMDPSRGTLTLSSAWPGGELFLSGQSFGPLPLKDVSICAGTYDLVVKYPVGGFSQRVEIPENKAVTLTAKPKPRMAYVGLDGSDDFPGRARLLAQLSVLGERLKEVAFLKPKDGESSAEAMTRLKATKEAELFLSLQFAKDRQGYPVDLILSTSEGEEERLPIKALDEDPIADFVTRLNTQPALWEPSVGLVVADLPGESGPVVLNAGDAANAAKLGVQVLKPITIAGGKPVTSALAFRQIVLEAKGETLSLTQSGLSLNLPVVREPLEIPLHGVSLCYPFVLSELRLRSIAAKGDEAAFLKLNQAIALMHFRRFEKALELLREAKVSAGARPGSNPGSTPGSALGLGQGTVDYYTGICLSKLGNVYIPEAIQAFTQAQKSPGSTLFGPDGPLVAPIAKQAAEDLKN